MPVTIERLGHRGDGVAAGPVYVPRTLPGEVVDGEIAGNRIEAPRILTPAPERVTAPCPHYRSCGGCALMHASDAFVAGWKTEAVRRALAAQGLPAPIRGNATSPERARRRATFSGRRLKSGPVVGFHARASDTVVPVPECRLVRPELLGALPALRKITAATCSRKGEMRFAVTLTEAGIDADVSGGRPLDGALRSGLARIADDHDLARLTVEGEPVSARRPPRVRFGPTEVALPPGAFLQATLEGEMALRDAVREAVGPARRIADLFAGCGTFALPLAGMAEVHAVETDAEMLAALQGGWRHGSGLKAVSTERRDLFRRPFQPDELSRFDAVVIDPPRAGAEAQARALSAGTASRIAAVSCDPATFARDAKRLVGGGYRLEWVQVVDQFRWSTHVELAAAFVRDRRSPGV